MVLLETQGNSLLWVLKMKDNIQFQAIVREDPDLTLARRIAAGSGAAKEGTLASGRAS